ncbi:MAG: 2-phospho-L-lactate transferase, partial [Chloroflexota bacterium]
MITALCGGVGGAKLALGLYRELPAGELSVIVNTADDLEFCGLRVSPDLDTVMYTLAGLARRDAGWGIQGDTFHALDGLRHYGAEAWFQVGDRDLATDVFRTQALRQGKTLTEVTAAMAGSLGVRASILPMTDGQVATRLRVHDSWIAFQDYFVRRGHRDPVSAVEYSGIEAAFPTEAARAAVEGAEAIVLVNSNPVLSILPAVSLPGMRELLAGSGAPRVAVSPIIGSDAISGPAGELMALIGEAASVLGVARAYREFIDGIVIDDRDSSQADDIRSMG